MEDLIIKRLKPTPLTRYNNKTNSEIKQDITEIVEKFEPYYYISSHNQLIRNKSSKLVEDKIEAILQNGMTIDDLPLIIAWKIGTIDHKKSIGKIVYRNNCNSSLLFKTQYNTIDANNMVNYIDSNFVRLKQLAKTNPFDLFTELMANRAKYFGATYVFTLLYFLSDGDLPIYDKYAYKALLAIKKGLSPGNPLIEYKDIPSSSDIAAWNHYCQFCQLLMEIVGTSNYKNRKYDRALWVYGHLKTQ